LHHHNIPYDVLDLFQDTVSVLLLSHFPHHDVTGDIPSLIEDDALFVAVPHNYELHCS